MQQLSIRRTFSMLFLLLLAIGLTGSMSADSQDGTDFSVADVEGPYAVSFDGFLIVDGQAIPVAAAARLNTDGAGGIDGITRTLNLGGQIFRQTGSGTFTVNPDGTGTVEVTIITLEPAGIPDTSETIEFVITDEDATTIDFVVVQSDFGPIVARGTAHQQESDS